MNIRIGVLLLAAISMTGCATQGINTYKQTDNAPINIDNQVVISKPPQQVWDILVKELSKSSYKMSSIDRESRIINASFTSNTPTEYVDCGKTLRTYTQSDIVETFEYDTAGSAIFKVAAARQDDRRYANYSVVRRESMLEGNPSIYIAADDKDAGKSIVMVNASFTLNFKVQGENFAKHLKHSISRGQMPGEIAMVTFSTNKPVQREDILGDGTKMTCFSKGKVEKEILDLVRSEQKAVEQKSSEVKAGEPKGSEQKAIEQKSSEQKVSEKQTADQNTNEQKAMEEKAAKQKAIEQLAIEKQAAEQKDSEQKGK